MLLPILLSSVVSAQETPPRVLHLGNSYTFFNDLQFRVADALRASVPAMHDAEGERLTAGGLRLPDHVDRVERGDAEWVDKLTGEPGRWAWMVLQDQSQIPGFPETERYWQESADAVSTLDGYAVDQGAETVLFMTWGRRDGDSTNPSMYPDFTTMNDRLDAGYRSYATRTSVDGRTIWVAPAGRAFAAVYNRILAEGGTPEDAGSDFHRLYDGDGSHPSALGTALSASVFVRTFTGWPPAWDTTPPGVDAADLDWMLDAANAAVVPFDDLAYPWAVMVADYSAPPDMDPGLGWVASGDQLCVTVGVDSAQDDVEQVTLGVLHDATPGCGRVWMLDGGGWSVERVDAEAGATGELVVAGGSFTLRSAASVPLVVSGGTLSLADGTTGTTLDQSAGTVVVSVAGPPTFSDTVSLAGTLQVDGTLADSASLMASASITVADDLAHNLPDDWALEVRSEDGTDTLWAVAPDAGGDDAGGDGDGGGAVDEGTAGETTSGGGDGGEDDPEDEASSSGTSPADKSGCAVTAGAMGGLTLALFAVWGRRRDT